MARALTRDALELWQVLYRIFFFLLVLQNMVQNPAIGPEMASTGAFDFSALQLYADDTERILICCHGECGFALSVSRSQATSHLRDKHNISKELRDGLTRYLKHGHPYPFRNPADVAPRDDGSQVHRMLRIYDTALLAAHAPTEP